jgi:hypothetical protein
MSALSSALRADASGPSFNLCNLAPNDYIIVGAFGAGENYAN